MIRLLAAFLTGLTLGLTAHLALGYLWPVRVDVDEPGGGWDEAVLAFASGRFPWPPKVAAEPRG